MGRFVDCPPRALAPPVRPIRVSRQFVRDFNRIDTFYDWTEAERSAAKARVRADAAAHADVARLAAVVRALEVVARHYAWTEAERAEWRAALAAPGQARAYIANLALALQHGYRQTPENGYQRLPAWLAEHGFDALTGD